MMRKNDSSSPSRQRIALTWIPAKSFRLAFRRSARPERRGHTSHAQPVWGRVRRFALTASLLLSVALLLVGCSVPFVRQQRLVSKPNMTFSDSTAFSYNSSRLLPQLATGFSAAGGPQN